MLRPLSRPYHHYDYIQSDRTSGDQLTHEIHPDSVPYVVYDSLPRQERQEFGSTESPPPVYSENVDYDGYLVPSGNDIPLRQVYHYGRGFEGRETGPLMERPEVCMTMTL